MMSSFISTLKWTILVNAIRNKAGRNRGRGGGRKQFKQFQWFHLTLSLISMSAGEMSRYISHYPKWLHYQRALMKSPSCCPIMWFYCSKVHTLCIEWLINANHSSLHTNREICFIFEGKEKLLNVPRNMYWYPMWSLPKELSSVVLKTFNMLTYI